MIFIINSIVTIVAWETKMARRPFDQFVPGPLLSSGEVARYCDTTVKQVNLWINNGLLPAFRTPGGNYRIKREDFRAFLERQGMPIVEKYFRDDHPNKILIADDDDTVVEVIQDIVTRNVHNIEVKTARDGYEALITAGGFNPDLLILDMRMPKIDGLEVCRRLRDNDAISRDMKILAMTAHSDAYQRETVLEAGANEYLIKPIEMDTLLEYIKKLL
jgi:excisionase family DNA binding protein